MDRFAWPLLPNLAQRALNASNQVRTQTNEMETGASIAEYLTACTRRGIKVDTMQVVEAVEGSSECDGYVDKVAKMVLLYSGGKGAPAIHRIADFHKMLGGSGKLGELHDELG